jgi:hypothetical protein
MHPDDQRWILKEQAFRSSLPLVGGIVAWFREMWNSVATKWYVRPLIEQQNAINRGFLDELERIHDESLVVQNILVRLDDEQLDTRRVEMSALYALADDVRRLHARLDALESRFTAGDDVA